MRARLGMTSLREVFGLGFGFGFGSLGILGAGSVCNVAVQRGVNFPGFDFFSFLSKRLWSSLERSPPSDL